MTTSAAYDVIVAGAGTAGSAAAYFMAQAGFKTALLEQGAFDKAGARWSNAIPPWMFDRATLDRPSGEECRIRGNPFSVGGLNGTPRVLVEDGPAWNVDMRRLVSRLQNLARDAGVVGFDYARIEQIHTEGSRPQMIGFTQTIPNKPQQEYEFEAKLFIDATGLSGAVRKMVPELHRHCPQVSPRDICTAMQESCSITDEYGAREFLRINNIPTGLMLNEPGLNGGFSTLSVLVGDDLEEVDILVGSIADGKHGSGPELMKTFKSKESWIGPAKSGGTGLIPLRRSYDRLTAPGVALVGNSACQVLSAHGSGVGAGLIAARMLAEAVSHHYDPGSERALWDYQAAFQRSLGAINASYDIFRRMSQDLSHAEIGSLIEAGLINAQTSYAAMNQQMYQPDLKSLVSLARGAMKTPTLAGRLISKMLVMKPVERLYRSYPKTPGMRKLKAWSYAVARLFGDEPDVR